MLMAGGVTAALVAAGPVGGTAVAADRVGVAPTETTNCGRVTCSDYLSRSETRAMLRLFESEGNPAKVLKNLSCDLAGGKRTPTCKVAKGALTVSEEAFSRTLRDAVSRNACYKRTYEKRTGLTTYVSTNQGEFCRD